MKVKAITSSFLVILHVAILLWYYSHDVTWNVVNKELASFIFFGVTFILMGANMLITALNSDFPPQLEITKSHSVFILLLGMIYAMHYSGFMVTNNKEKLVMICAGVLVIFIMIVISAWRHGLFNKNTYD